MKTILRTNRLILRPPCRKDEDRIIELAGNINVSRNLLRVPWPYERSDAKEWLSRVIGEHDAGQPRAFAITLAETSELIGVIGIHPAEGNAPRASFGYWLGEAYWGRGYATEALSEILRYGFDDRSFHRIEACHLASNPASGRVMQKAGMQYEGVRRQRLYKDGQSFDEVLYGILEVDWRAHNTTQSVTENPIIYETLITE